MKKSKCVTMLLTALACSSCMAQTPRSYTRDYRNALRYGAKAKMTLRIVNDGGNPVSNAVASVVFLLPKAVSNTVVRGLSNEEGLFVAEGVSTKSIGGYVSKDGYYSTNFKCPRGNPADPYDNASKVKDGRWLPWNPTIPVVLREIRNPIPMYVKIFDGELTNGATCGFDCEAGDFVEPYGRGVESDFMVTCKGAGIPGTKTTHSIEMVVSDPAGGFMAKKKHSSSAFKSDYLAPEQGYSTNIFAKMEYDSQHGVSGSSVFQGDEYLVFKSRVKRDEEGNIVSANYGKFYSGIEFMRGVGEHVGVGFLYYFNPTPNDRNIEFDGKNNLFKPGWNSKLNWSREP